ncbi:MAG: hypothetical protein J7M39_04165 [Anaerolineae bacterium]|nr:hypothetical protein [Anaerolineae bacterium]
MDKAIQNAASGAEGTKISVEDQTRKLARVYLLVGCVVLAVLGVIIGLIYRTIAVSRIINAAEGQNIAFAQRFANTSWTEFGALVDDAHDMSGDELRQHAEAAELRQAILAQVGDSPVVRVSLYAKEGTIIFSTTPEEIGQYVNHGVVREMVSGHWYWSGRSPAITELTHYETFKALDSELLDRDLVASLVPIPTVGPRLAALLQVTRDVTPQIQRIARAQLGGMGSVILVSTALLGSALFLMDRRKVVAPGGQSRKDG